MAEGIQVLYHDLEILRDLASAELSPHLPSCLLHCSHPALSAPASEPLSLLLPLPEMSVLPHYICWLSHHSALWVNGTSSEGLSLITLSKVSSSTTNSPFPLLSSPVAPVLVRVATASKRRQSWRTEIEESVGRMSDNS